MYHNTFPRRSPQGFGATSRNSKSAKPSRAARRTPPIDTEIELFSRGVGEVVALYQRYREGEIHLQQAILEKMDRLLQGTNDGEVA